MKIRDKENINKKYEKLLTIKVGTRLNFNEHLKKASHRVNALPRVMRYMSLSQKKILINSFFSTSQLLFLYLISHSCIMDNKINNLEESWFSLLCGNKKSSFEKLLEQYEPFSIHTGNF